MSAAPAFWCFLPDEPAPNVASLGQAAKAGKGAFARALREARARLGVQRAAALLRQTEMDRASARPFTLLLVTTFQPRAIEDALRVAFAIAGIAVDIRPVDGLGAIGAASFAEADMIFLPLLQPVGELPFDPSDLVSGLSGRSDAPILVATNGSSAPIPSAEVLALTLAGPAIDERFAGTFGLIPTAEAADRLADAAAGFAAARAGLAPKLIVTDLDGTLWRGTLGEDGPEALGLHQDYASALRMLGDRGYVLGIASRNDARDVEAAFAAHPEWPVARKDFAALAVGWDDKAALAERVLEQLNLAPEHLVFIDDDPVNCAAVAGRFPASDVRLFGTDPSAFAAALLDDPVFGPFGSRGSDRTGEYQRREAVERLRAETPDRGDFLRRLRTALTVVRLDGSIVPRAAELASRVNQFALNGRRPGVAELRRRESPFDFMIRLDDAFGPHGLVGLVLARAAGDAVEVESFFLSCRAFGRGIEEAMLVVLRTMAREKGCDRVVGTIETLPRNEPARRCFSRYLDAGSGESWTLPAADDETGPEGVTIRWPRTAT